MASEPSLLVLSAAKGNVIERVKPPVVPAAQDTQQDKNKVELLDV